MKKLFLLLLFAGAVQCAHAQLGSVRFSGMIGFESDISKRSASITIAKIENIRNGGTSGSLYVQAWLFPTAYTGTVQNGYKLGEVSLGTLRGGYMWTDMRYAISWEKDPPAGTWHIALLLLEYNPQASGSYWALDWVNFDQLAVLKKRETRAEHLSSLNVLLKKTENQYFETKSGQVTYVVNQKFSDIFRFQTIENNKSVVREFEDIPWDALLTNVKKIENAREGSDVVAVMLKFDEPVYFNTYVDKNFSEAASGNTKSFAFYIRRSDWEAVQTLLAKIAYADE